MAGSHKQQVVPRWSVDIIRKRAEHLGEAEAPDERGAIKRRLRSLPTRQRGRTVSPVSLQ